MKAMVLERPGEPLREVERAAPNPGPGQVRLRVTACGVCRTDLHVVDGELPDLGRPVVPGHQIVGVVEAAAHLAEAGGEVSAVVCAVWRGEGEPAIAGLKAPVFAAFVKADLEQALA